MLWWKVGWAEWGYCLDHIKNKKVNTQGASCPSTDTGCHCLSILIGHLQEEWVEGSLFKAKELAGS